MAKILFILLSFSLVLQSRHPRFSDYRVDEQLKRKPVRVDLKSDPQAKTYRTRLREGAEGGPNFSGHYTVVIWGCGSNCQNFAIINARTGKVYFYPGMTSYGMLYRIDSNLIITDPISAQDTSDFQSNIPDWRMTRYLVWDGIKLTQVDSTKSVLFDQ